MAIVSVEGLRKAYGNHEVIHGVDIDIADGEFVILVGPSGCGKSTLLRMIAGLEDITSGRIQIGERVVNNLQPKERDIAMVFQNYALYPQMTVEQNMGFALEIAGVRKAEVKTKVDRAAEILGLQPLLARKPAQLSGGQRQRVAMGRAIVRDPSVFLFDEPLSNLDAKLRVQMRAEIKSLQQRLKTTTIYVTHDQVEAMTMADKIVVLNAGSIEQVGSPLELYDRPANMFVAGFIGSPSMNFIEGKIEAGSGSSVLTTLSGARLPLAGAPQTGEERVVFGIRPEHVVIDRSAGVPAEVVVVEPTGAETHLLARIGSHDLTCVLRDRVTLRAGDAVPLSFRDGAAHFFSPETGKRLD